MAETETNKTSQSEEIEHKDANLDDDETENLSTKLSNIAVVNSSLQNVSKTCHTIKESNSYVGYGMTVAESSLDKAFKAGKAVLESRTLAPIANTAMENIRYLDKEAGVMVDKFLKSSEKEENERHPNGAVQEISDNITAESTGLVIRSESMFYFLGRKFFEVTSFLILFPYFAPKYALSTIWNLLQGSRKESGRKRKERGSMSEDVKYMEPSPVKRKYGDRQSTSSDEETLVEILRDYVSEEDSDYVPNEHGSEETSEESGHESDKDDAEECRKECLDLTQEMKQMGIPLCDDIQKGLEKIKGTENESEPSKCQSAPKNAAESQQVSSAQNQNPPTAVKTDETKAETIAKSEVVSPKRLTDSTTKAEQKVEEILLKETTSERKDKTESTKDAKESKSSKIDPSSKTRRSTKSPLLEKLLSPGRRRKSQKDKTKSGDKESSESAGFTEVIADEGSSKPEGNTMKAKTDATKIEDISKNVSKTEGKAEDATKTKEKSENGQKNEGSQKSKSKSEKKAESSKAETKAAGESHPGNHPLSTVTGPFDVFKFGGKKSK